MTAQAFLDLISQALPADSDKTLSYSEIDDVFARIDRLREEIMAQEWRAWVAKHPMNKGVKGSKVGD
jgi:hypothetical protein